MRPLIFSIDYFEGKLFFVARMFSGWRELFLYEDKKLTKLLQESQKLSLQEVKFVDTDRLNVQLGGRNDYTQISTTYTHILQGCVGCHQKIRQW